MRNWFKNLQIYRLPKGWSLAPEVWGLKLAAFGFTPPTGLEASSTGWSSVHNVGKRMLLTLTTEKKSMPAGAIRLELDRQLTEIAEQQGFRPGRKQTKEVKEQVIDALLPRALSVQQHTRVLVDQINGWLIVDSATPAGADTVLKFLLKAIDKFPVESLHLCESPRVAMTDWLASDEAPAGFTIDQDTDLRANGESKATVKFVRHTLEHADVARHISAGKQCTRLAMTWADKISFVLTESLTLKRIEPLDVLAEPHSPTEDVDERRDADFVLMSGELAALLRDLVDALGGEVLA